MRLNSPAAIQYVLGALCVTSLIGIVVIEVVRSGKLIYRPGQKRERATKVQIALVAIFAVSGLTLLLLT
jgi:hypothetical protein